MLRALRRHAAAHAVERRVLIVTEGTVTEPLYFDDFVSRRAVPGVEVRVLGVGMDPVSLVQRAVRDRDTAAALAHRQRDTTAAFDEVWCVFDVDAFGSKVAEARELARVKDVQVAISNPCFELWLMLHLQEPPGPIDRHDLQARFQALHPMAEKYFNVDVIGAGYDDAVRRATRLDKDADEVAESGRNPTTGVYRLTESIDAEGRARREAQANAPAQARLDDERARQRAREEAALAQAQVEGWRPNGNDEAVDDDDDDDNGDEGGAA